MEHGTSFQMRHIQQHPAMRKRSIAQQATLFPDFGGIHF
jgi:hypothetical protein